MELTSHVVLRNVGRLKDSQWSLVRNYKRKTNRASYGQEVMTSVLDRQREVSCRKNKPSANMGFQEVLWQNV